MMGIYKCVIEVVHNYVVPSLAHDRPQISVKESNAFLVGSPESSLQPNCGQGANPKNHMVMNPSKSVHTQDMSFQNCQQLIGHHSALLDS